jgi:hypothetical protein
MKFYYQIMGEEFGPVSSSELKRLASEGQIWPDTFVRKDGGNWHVAESVKGLFREPTPARHELAESVPAEVITVEVVPVEVAEIITAETTPASLSRRQPQQNRRPPQNVDILVIVAVTAVGAVGAVVAITSMRQSEESGHGKKEWADQSESLSQIELDQSESLSQIELDIRQWIRSGRAFDRGTYPPGRIPRGLYAYVPTGTLHYYSEKDLNGNIVANEGFQSFGYVYVHGIGNVETRGVLVSFDVVEASEYRSVKRIYEMMKGIENYDFSGHYLIGTDIPAGKYMLTSVGEAYYALTNGPVGRDEIVGNDIFSGSQLIVARTGQYLKLSKARFALFSRE